MEITPENLLEKAALTFWRARQPLAAAVLFADLVGGGSEAPPVWCGLGSSLMASRGVLVRQPFEAWAARVFARAMPLVAGTPFEAAAKTWAAELPVASAVAFTAAEAPALLDFLLVTDAVLPDAVAPLPEEDRMFAVMAMGDRANVRYVPVLCAAIDGRFGPGAARSALKRVGPFLDRVDLRAALGRAARAPASQELQPYLGWVLARIGQG